MRILVVDDTPGVVADIVRRLLQLAPAADIVCAGSVAEARGALRFGLPQLAIIDRRLGDGTGYDVMRDLAAARYDGPTMMITFLPDPILRASAKIEGATDMYCKAYEMDDMLLACEKYIMSLPS